jgi:hypothetical protein
MKFKKQFSPPMKTDKYRWRTLLPLSVFICFYLWRTSFALADTENSLVLNPGLEDVGQNQLPAHWEKFVVSVDGKMTIDTDVKHSGRQSIRIDAPENTRLYLRSDPIPVVPGEKITASAWVKFKNVPLDKGSMILIAEFTNSKDHSSQDKGTDVARFEVVERKNTDGDWRRISGTVTVPPMMANVRLRAGFSYAQGTCWWDDFTVTAQQPVVARIDLPDERLSPAAGTIPIGILNRDGTHEKIHIAVSLGKVIKIATTQPLTAGAVDVQLNGQPQQQVEVPLEISQRGLKMFLTAGASAVGNPNKLFSEDRRPVQVPEAVVLNPIVPTHWCVEDGPPVLSGEVDLAIKNALLQGAALSVNVTDANDKSVFTFTPPSDRPLADGANPFDLKLPQLPQGDYKIVAQIKPTSGAPLQGEQPFGIIPRRLAKVTLNADGYPVYDGKAIFPMGIFNGGGHTKEMGEAGFTVNHAYNAANAELGIAPPDAYAKEFLDTSAAAGMKVCFLIPRGLAFGGDWDGVRRRIRLFKNNPALLCWDEEEGLARGDLKMGGLIKLRQIIQEEDPNHPLMIGDTRDVITRMPQDRADIFPVDQMDLGMWWWYPLPLQARGDSALNGEDASTGTELIEPGFLSKPGTNKPIWTGIQSYKKPKSRYPTATEFRAQAYLSVIWGAKGMMWYGGSVEGGIYSNLKEGHWDDLKKLAGELHEMIPIFMGKTLAAPTLEPSSAPVSFMLKQDGNHIVLLAANRSVQPTQVTIRSPQIHSGSVAVFKENRQINANSGSFTDHFDALEVHVYELAK